MVVVVVVVAVVVVVVFLHKVVGNREKSEIDFPMNQFEL